MTTSIIGTGGTISRAVSACVRLTFFLWLYDVTDGAAFSPFSFVPDLPGGSVWQPVLAMLGTTEMVGRVRAYRAGREQARPATAVPILTT